MQLRSSYFFSFLALITACSNTPVAQSQSTGPQHQIATRPEPPPKSKIPAASPEKLFDLARKAFDAKDFNKAFDFYTAAANGWQGQPRETEALVWADRSLIRGNRNHESAELSAQLLKTRKLQDTNVSELTSYLLRSEEAISDYQGAFVTSFDAFKNLQLKNEMPAYKLKLNDLIENKLSREQLEAVAGQEKYENFRSAANFRLAQLSLENHDNDSAKKYLGRSLSVSPGSEWAPKAQDLLNSLESVSRVEPKTIGVVLPMSGKYATISQKTLRGVQMGLGLYNNQPSSFRLAVIDSEGNPDNARRGVEKLVKEDNVISIIGSVLSKTAPAVAAKATELGVPSIALSQKAGVTEVGPMVFRNSLTSEMQVRYLVKVAMEEMGMKRFAILFPNDQYGVEFANIFWDEVSARGGTVVGAQNYSNKETDFRDSIQRLVGTYYLESRSEEYRLRLKDWSEAQTKRNARTTPPEDLLPPIVDFDGVFIPDNVKALGQISAMLSFNGVKGVQLLGTNLWNTPGLAKRAGHFAGNLLFVDSFFGTEPRFAESQFVKDYKTIYGEEPGIFEIQGYDSALMLRQLISQGNTSRDTLAKALASVEGFPGAVGPLSMTPDKEVMRPLVALTLDSASNVIPFQKPKTP